MRPALQPAIPVNYSIVVVGAHELFRTALAISLRGSGFPAQALAAEGTDAVLAQARRLPPGAAVLDLADGHDPLGVELITQLRSRGWAVLMLTDTHHDDQAAAAIAAGADGVISLLSSFDTLAEAIHATAAGRPLLSQAERSSWLAHHHRHEAEKRRLDRLTRRERDVLALLIQGHRADDVAKHFVVSLATVRTHIRAILAKLQVSSQLEAVAVARRHPRPGNTHPQQRAAARA